MIILPIWAINIVNWYYVVRQLKGQPDSLTLIATYQVAYMTREGFYVLALSHPLLFLTADEPQTLRMYKRWR